MNNYFEHNHDQNILKFESMLKTNNSLFFDSNEFEEIICYYLDSGNISLAKKANSLSLEQHPDSIFLILIKIEILLLENKVLKAEKLLNKLYSKDPTNSEIILQKSKIFSKQNKHLESIELLKKIDENSDSYYDAISLIAKEYIFLEDFENAKNNFLKCLEINKSDTSILNKIIFCYDSINAKNDTIDFLKEFIESNPYCEIAWHHLGNQYVKISDYEKALSSFEFAIISDESFEGAYIEMGKVLEKLKKFNEAIEKYEISLGISGPDSYTYYRLGKCHDKIGNYDLAFKYYKQTLDCDPLHSSSLMRVAKYYFRKKNFKQSKVYVLKALEIDPGKIKYIMLNIKIIVLLRQFKEFEKAFTTALRCDELSFKSLVFLIKKFIEHKNELNFKSDFLSSVIKISGQFSNEIHYPLASLYFCNDKDVEGIVSLRKAYNSIPHRYNFYKKVFSNLPKLNFFKTLL